MMQRKLLLFSSIVCVVLLAWILDTSMQPQHCINSNLFSHLYIEKQANIHKTMIPSCEVMPYFQPTDMGEYVTTRDIKDRIYEIENNLKPIGVDFKVLNLKILNIKPQEAKIESNQLMVNLNQFFQPHFLEVVFIKYFSHQIQSKTDHAFINLMTRYAILNKNYVYNGKTYKDIDFIYAQLIKNNFNIQCETKWQKKTLLLCTKINMKSIKKSLTVLSQVYQNVENYFLQDLKTKIYLFKQASHQKLNYLKINNKVTKNSFIYIDLKNKKKFFVDSYNKKIKFNKTISDINLTITSGCHKPDITIILKKYKKSKKVLYLQNCNLELVKNWENLINNQVNSFIKKNPNLIYYYFHIPSIQLALSYSPYRRNWDDLFLWENESMGFLNNITQPRSQFNGMIHYREKLN